jgi:hypothetical protein
MAKTKAVMVEHLTRVMMPTEVGTLFQNWFFSLPLEGQAEKFELSDLHLELIAEYEAAERCPGAKTSTAAAVSGGCGVGYGILLLRTPVSLARP